MQPQPVLPAHERSSGGFFAQRLREDSLPYVAILLTKEMPAGESQARKEPVAVAVFTAPCRPRSGDATACLRRIFAYAICLISLPQS